MSTLRILSDSKIPFVTDAFSHIGAVTIVDNESICPEAVRAADILLVRSETRVDARLLAGSAVKFVGSPTSGTDHIDREYLRSRNIAFAHAPGANARSVAEYVLAALLVLCQKWGETLAGKTLAVVGVGNIGSIVAGFGRALGMRVLCHDPPLQRVSGDPTLVPFSALSAADYLTIHVPLNKSGDDPTYHLFDEQKVQALSPECVLLNTSRGPVVDNSALKEMLLTKRLRAAVLDVWEDEPDIDWELLPLPDIATPHIAGYSWDGKVRGTEAIYRAACERFGVNATWHASGPGQEVVSPPAWQTGASFESNLSRLVYWRYDILRDHRALRDVVDLPSGLRAACFSGLRKGYPIRREFGAHALQGHGLTPKIQRQLQALGFCLSPVGE